LISLRFKYAAAPKKAFISWKRRLKTAKSSETRKSGRRRAQEARHWFPSFDFPSDKATTEQFITAEKGETVIGNGAFWEKPTTRTYGDISFQNAVPHSTYLTSFIVGKYAKSTIHTKTFRSVLRLSGRESIAAPASAKRNK
jgi:aminopeptidase N